MNYQSVGSAGAGVRRLADDAFIPEDQHNRDWQAYQAWLKAGNQPLPATGPSLADRKAEASQQIVAFADRLSARLTASFPAAEQASWPLQVIEARAFVEGKGQQPAALVPTPLLSALLAAQGTPAHAEALGVLAQGVLAKSTAYGAVVAAIIALRSRAQAAIAAAADDAALAAALSASQAEAAKAAKALGIAS
ncbi:MAG: hypothetical protein KGQ37_01420 [Hyphomicrobiales bacterium]|nr:hypothetical protein [Hyphomicrobiales bacterium]